MQSPQGSGIKVAGRDVVNFCANNYLGLANHPDIVAAAAEGLKRFGYGMASVRFICGTQEIHRQFEQAVARFLGKDDAILYSSCWDANGGLFETILGEDDAVISDELNHASIIDGVRLSKAKRFRYKNCDMAELERCLIDAKDARFRLIATDGVFSMDGSLAPLPDICALADKHDAIVMVDDSHATGILGTCGRGTAEALRCLARIDTLTSTPGKTLGGAAEASRPAVRSWSIISRQRSRPYLFSNAVPPPIIMAAMKRARTRVQEQRMCDRLHTNAKTLRGLEKAGFKIKPGQHPSCPSCSATRAGDEDGRQIARKRHLCYWLQLPRCATRISSHSHPAFRAHTSDQLIDGNCRVHRSRQRTRRDLVL